jgi:hypothetical protein
MTTDEIFKLATYLKENYKPNDEHLVIFEENKDLKKELFFKMEGKVLPANTSALDVPNKFVKSLVEKVENVNSNILAYHLDEIQEVLEQKW